jgi:ribosomal protein S18 acetylase RimI-like enzyme
VTGSGGADRLAAEMVTIRPATPADAPAMGRVHVRAWQAAYRGHMPDEYLDGLRSEDRAAHWAGALARDDLRGTILVAERAGEVVGFAVVGPAREPAGAGELYAINLDPAHWGTGAGRALLGAAQTELARLGFADTVLWVLTGNARARRFYEIAGWVAEAAERTDEVFGVTVSEVRYARRSTSADSSSATPPGTV